MGEVHPSHTGGGTAELGVAMGPGAGWQAAGAGNLTSRGCHRVGAGGADGPGLQMSSTRKPQPHSPLLCPICPLGKIVKTHKSQMTLIAEDGPRPRYALGLARPS